MKQAGNIEGKIEKLLTSTSLSTEQIARELKVDTNSLAELVTRVLSRRSVRSREELSRRLIASLYDENERLLEQIEVALRVSSALRVSLDERNKEYGELQRLYRCAVKINDAQV